MRKLENHLVMRAKVGARRTERQSVSSKSGRPLAAALALMTVMALPALADEPPG